MANVLPNMLSMAWISYFFSGFIIIKLPFPLTNSFKAMLQQGIAIDNLDPSYVSSLSWYFINLFGTRGILSLVLDQFSN
jgi:ER membrane protein complex subunit 3